MAWVATQNFRIADRLAERATPAARLELKVMGPNARTLLRYQASEDNRALFHDWEVAQLLLGTGFFLLMLFGSRESKVLLCGIVLLLVLTAFERFVLTPAVTAQGRVLDFVTAGQQTGDRNQFWVLHSAYVGVELGKWALTLSLAAQMVFSRRRSGRSRDARSELDLVNKANYRRVDW